MTAAAGSLGVTGTFSSEGSRSHAFPPVTAQGPVFSYGGRPSQSNPFVTGLSRSGTVVAPGGQVAVRSSSPGSTPVPVVVYRLIPVGLGGAPSRSDGLRGLARGRDPGTHQCAGNAGSRTGSSCLPASVDGAECRPDE